MPKYLVRVTVEEHLTVEADSKNEAEQLAIIEFNRAWDHDCEATVMHEEL